MVLIASVPGNPASTSKIFRRQSLPDGVQIQRDARQTPVEEEEKSKDETVDSIFAILHSFMTRAPEKGTTVEAVNEDAETNSSTFEELADDSTDDDILDFVLEQDFDEIEPSEFDIIKKITRETHDFGRFNNRINQRQCHGPIL